MVVRKGVARHLTALALILTAGGAHAETLADALGLAYQTNPTLQNQRAQQRALDENYVQARVGYRPTLSLSAEAAYQDAAGRETESSGIALSATQPLYTGGRVSAAVTAAQADILAGRESLRQVEADVLQAVIQAYVDVRRDQRILAIAQENVEILRRQVEESDARFAVGEITRTDVAQSQAELASARSELSVAQGQLAVSRATYAAVVGQSPSDLAAEPPIPLLPASIEEAFAKAERNNPTLRQAEYAEQASRARVAAARAERMPSVGLRATLGYSGPLSDYDPADFDRSITASATVSQPLFAGGAINSRVRQALERNNASRIQVEGARRALLRDLSQGWNALLTARSNITSNEEQVRAARLAFEGTLEERKVGLRTTLEVLTAQQNLRDAELALVISRRDEYVAGASVLNAMGLLEARNIAPGAPLYDPAKSFNRVKYSGWLPWEPVISTVDSLGAPRVKTLPLDPAAPISTAPPPAPAQ